MNLESLGHAAAVHQLDPRIIEVGLKVVQGDPMQARPAMTLNGLRYFTVDDIVKAVAWVREYEADRARKEAAAGE